MHRGSFYIGSTRTCEITTRERIGLVKLGACISCAGCSSDSMLALSTSCGYEWRVNVLLLQIFDARYSSVC